jgi:hypothetical protein
LIVGDDVFISYAHEDGGKQAVELARQLRRHHLTYYLDRLGSRPGKKLPSPLISHVRNASMLVVICTPAAIGSEAIRREIELFRKMRRNLLLFGEPKIGHQVAEGSPTVSTVAEIVRAFVYTRLMVVRRRVVIASTIVLTVAGTWTLWGLHLANEKRDKALRQASDAGQQLNAARSELTTIQTQRNAAVKERDAAVGERNIAVGERDTAVGERDAARGERDTAVGERDAATAEAGRQRDIAAARYLSNRAVELAADSAVRVDAPLLTAIQSLHHGPTPEAIELVQRFAPLIPKVVGSVPQPRLDAAAISPSGRWFAVRAGEEVRLYSAPNRLRWRGPARVHGVRHNNQWLEFRPDESSLLFSTRDDDETQKVHVVKLQDVERDGEHARAATVGVPGAADRLFFTRGGTSFVATQYLRGPWFSSPPSTASTCIAPVDADSCRDVDGIGTLDATDKWIAGKTSADGPELVIVDRSSGSRAVERCNGSVRNARIVDDTLVYACVTDRPQTTVLRKLDLSKTPFAATEIMHYDGASGVFDLSPDGTLAVISVQEGYLNGGVAVVPLVHPTMYWNATTAGEPVSLRFSSDGTTIVASTFGGLSYAWDAQSGSELARLYWSLDGISSDGTLGAARNGDTLRLVHLRAPQERTLAGVVQTEMSDDGSVVAGLRRGDGMHRFFSTKPWQQLYETKHRGLVAFGRAGKHVALGDRTLSFVDLRSGVELRVPDLELEQDEIFKACAFSGDERWAAIAIRFREERPDVLALVNVATGKLQELGELFGVYRFALAPRGDFIAAMGGRDVVIYAANGRKIVSEPSTSTAVADFSPDGSLAAIAFSGRIVLVDMLRGRVAQRLRLEDANPQVIRFRADSRAFFVVTGTLTAGLSRSVHVFDRSGTETVIMRSPFPINDAIWRDDESLRILAGDGQPRTLTWNAHALIREGCRAARMNPDPLPQNDANLLPREVVDASICGVAAR